MPIRNVVLISALACASLGVVPAAAQVCQPHWDTAVGEPGCLWSLLTIEAYRDRLFVGGSFTSMAGVTAFNIAQWDGQSWGPVGGGIGPLGATVNALRTFRGVLVVAGGFSTASGLPVGPLAQWDGTNWSAFAGGVTGSGGVGVLEVIDFDGAGGEAPALVAAGNFTSVGGLPARSVAKWDGTSWSRFGPDGFNGYVTAVAIHDDGQRRLYAAGDFTSSGTISVNRVARFDGTTWQPLGTGVHTGQGPYANAILSYAGRLYVGGLFSGVGNVTVDNVAAWYGGAWHHPGFSLSGGVIDFAHFDDGTGSALYIAGTFPGGLAKWNGSSLTAVWPGLNGSFPNSAAPRATAPWIVGSRRRLAVTGYFTHAGSVPVGHVAEWVGCDCYPDCNADDALTAADFGCFQTKLVGGDLDADCTGDGMLTVADFGCFQTKFVAGCP